MRGERTSRKLTYSMFFRESAVLRQVLRVFSLASLIRAVESSRYMTSKKERIQDWVVREWGGFQRIAINFLAAVRPARMTRFLSLEILRIDTLFRINTHTVTGTVSSIKSDKVDATMPQNCLTGGQSQNMWIKVPWTFKEHRLQHGSLIIFMWWSLPGWGMFCVRN